MTDHLPAPRRYDEREVRRLLARAAELQVASPAGGRKQKGLTLRELEEIAAEAGLDIGSLRQAAVELDSAPTGTAGVMAALAGGPIKVVIEHTIPRAIDADAINDLLPLIQRKADLPGQASQVGSTVSWTSQSQNGIRQFHATIAIRGDTTHVYIEERYGGLAGALFGGGIGGVGGGLGGALGGVAGGALGSVALAVALPITTVVGGYVAARTLFARYVGKRRRVLEQLLREITTRADS